MIDFSTYKFRCSGLHNLMVTPRSKSEVLSETTKSYLRELWIKEVYSREKYDKTNKYTKKGLLVEQDSLDLVESVTGDTWFKNRDELCNEWICGTPDVICKDEEKKPLSIKDTKSSWDIWTLMAVTEEKARKDYYYQMLGYMWLTNTQTAELLYCLVNTPEEIIQGELYKLGWVIPELSTNEEVNKVVRRNYEFDDINKTERLKRFVFEFDETLINSLINNISLSREYLQKLSL